MSGESHYIGCKCEPPQSVLGKAGTGQTAVEHQDSFALVHMLSFCYPVSGFSSDFMPQERGTATKGIFQMPFYVQAFLEAGYYSARAVHTHWRWEGSFCPWYFSPPGQLVLYQQWCVLMRWKGDHKLI